MARSGVSWTITPSAGIAAKIAQATAAIVPGIGELAGSHAARGEAEMKQGRTWTDRTGHARASLYGRAEGTTIHLGTTNREYGIYLELGTSLMRAYPIIQPTSKTVAEAYFADAAEFVTRLLGGGR